MINTGKHVQFWWDTGPFTGKHGYRALCEFGMREFLLAELALVPVCGDPCICRGFMRLGVCTEHGGANVRSVLHRLPECETCQMVVDEVFATGKVVQLKLKDGWSWGAGPTPSPGEVL